MEAEERRAAEGAAEATAEVVPGDLLDADEVRRRAAAGAAALGVRNVVLLAAGLVANLVLARLLVPSDFGYVALGQTLALVGSYLASGGIGIALIGRRAMSSRCCWASSWRPPRRSRRSSPPGPSPSGAGGRSWR
jgi:hypothetical protein